MKWVMTILTKKKRKKYIYSVLEKYFFTSNFNSELYVKID